MAHMIPPKLIDLPSSSAERKLFERFSREPGTESWTVFHSLNIANHRDYPFGEIDFLVCAPNLGIFCLEVKGGRVSRSGRTWQFTNRFGESKSTTKSPMQQVSGAMFGLINKVRDRFGDSHRLCRVLYAWGVMFPDIEFAEYGAELEPFQVWGLSSGSLRAYIEGIAEEYPKLMKDGRSNAGRRPTADETAQLVKFLSGDFTGGVSPIEELKRHERELSWFTDEQRQIVEDFLDGENERVVVRGAAGTGKTVVAIELARKAEAKGQRVMLVCFNTLLGSWLKNQTEAFAGPGSLTIGTLHEIMRRMSGAARESSMSDQVYFEEYLPLAAVAAGNRLGAEKFDLLVIDEGQDLVRPEYLDFFSAVLKGGFSDGRWVLFGDFQYQVLYGSTLGKDRIQLLRDRAFFADFLLKKNCRNTRHIIRDTGALLSLPVVEDHHLPIEGPVVNFHFPASKAQILTSLVAIIRGYLDEGVPPRTITVLAEHSLPPASITTLSNNDIELTDLADHPDLFADRTTVSFCTIRKFKGLENGYIILLDPGDPASEEVCPLLYVGMTRAKFQLDVVMLKKFEEVVYSRRKSSH